MSEEQRYIVTARKWRPLRFSDVVGQEHITTTLKNAIGKGRIHHAYVFTGPRGVGKTTCARILARALNCTNSTDLEPCNQCPSCTDMLEGRSVDIIEIDGASNNSVDDVRKLRDNAKYAPMSGRYKMYIIDEVHMLSTAAFNALLKTLEEPPAHLIFVFATTEIHKVPATILSRCQRFDFRRMEIDTITSHLRHIAAAEKITIDDASLVAIAKKADGSMRDSQSIFDQVVSFCGTSITIGDVSAALHLIDVDFFFALSTAIRSHDIPAMFALARQVIDRGYDLQECLIGLLEHFRNILTVITTKGTDLIEASAEHLTRYHDEAAQFTKEDALRIMTLLSQGEAVLRQNPPQPRVRFEFTLVQVASMDSSVDLGKVLAGLSGAPSQQRPASAPPAIPSTSSQRIVGGVAAIPQPIRVGSPVIVRAQKNPVSSLTAGNLARRWSDVLESLPEHLVFVKASVKQQMLTVDFTDIGIVLRPHAEIVHHRLIDKIAALKTHLAEMYNTPVGVQLIEPRTAYRLQASMKSEEESLVFQVLEPIAFGVSAANPGRAPAPMMLKLTGELQRWQRRGQLFAGIDPGVSVGGKIALDVQGAIDTKHVELTQADWVSEPFQVASGETVFEESKMVGKFQGRFDSSDLAKLQVDQLLVRADSFAVQAQDQAAEGGVGRRGQAAFRIDPARMMTSVRAPAGSSGGNRSASSNPTAGLLLPSGGNGLQPGSVQPNGNAVAAAASSSPPVRITGDVTGQMDWTLDPAQVQWHVVTQAKDLRAVQPILQRNPNQLVSTGGGNNPAETLLWEEPQAVVTVDGTYRFRDGDLQLTQVLAQTEWLAYGGMAAMSTEGQSTTVRSQGNLTYDAASVAQRLRPYTGGTLAASGQRTQPMEVTWTSTPGHKWTEALAARSSVGWDSANLVGIDIGGADIPLVIENGKFVSQAEFPVSQGMLRWNLDGDLAADPMVIRQSQQRVIENVAITRQMCQGWLKFVAPLLADVTSVQGNLSLDIDRAEIYPTESVRQTVAGKVMVQGANVGPGPLADQILGLVMQIRNLRRGAGASDGGGQPTSWLTLPEQSIPFVVERGRVTHKDMRIAAGDVVVTTSGSVGLDGSLELVAGIPILKEWVDKTPALQPLAGQMIQIPVRGTVQRPQLDSSGLVQLAQQLATSALAGAAQKQIDKGLNKLLGPLSSQLAPLQQGVQQLPLPNLSIPGFGANPFAPNAGGAAGVPGGLPSVPNGASGVPASVPGPASGPPQ